MVRIVFALLFLALPLIEIAGFALVGRAIGVFPTLALVIASVIVGSIMLRLQGLGALARMRQDVEAGRDPGRQLVHGVLILVAGILLIIPGFFTDLIGLLLFLPPVRDLVWRLARRRLGAAVSFRVFGGGPAGGASGRRGPTIDLDAADYSQTGNPESPWRRIDDDR